MSRGGGQCLCFNDAHPVGGVERSSDVDEPKWTRADRVTDNRPGDRAARDEAVLLVPAPHLVFPSVLTRIAGLMPPSTA